MFVFAVFYRVFFYLFTNARLLIAVRNRALSCSHVKSTGLYCGEDVSAL